MYSSFCYQVDIGYKRVDVEDASVHELDVRLPPLPKRAVEVQMQRLGGFIFVAIVSIGENYIVQKVIDLSKDDATLKTQRVFVSKLNLILVHVLKQEWPHNWPSFIGDIVGSSKTNEALCENNMHILKLLSKSTEAR